MEMQGFDPASIVVMLGKLVHLTADALIISAFLAGIKRSTGVTFVAPELAVCSALLGSGLVLGSDCLSSPALDKVASKDLRCTSFDVPDVLDVLISPLLHATDWVASYLETGRLAPSMAALRFTHCTWFRRIHLRPRRRLPRPLLLL
jgi:hypothetical protein